MTSLSKYDPGVTPILCGHLSARGLTDEQIGTLLGVKENTFKSWRHRRPELVEAMKPGKDFIDSLVEGSLLKQALGSDVEEITRERVPTGKMKADGTPRMKMQVTKRVRRQITGNTIACFFWLKNRQPKTWKDRNYVTIDDARPYEQMSDEELRQIVAAGAVDGNGAGRN
jgi:hypothetical protein